LYFLKSESQSRNFWNALANETCARASIVALSVLHPSESPFCLSSRTVEGWHLHPSTTGFLWYSDRGEHTVKVPQKTVHALPVTCYPTHVRTHSRLSGHLLEASSVHGGGPHPQLKGGDLTVAAER
jgi:hypothetical protein